MLMLINLIGYIRLIMKMRRNSIVVSCGEITNFTQRKVTVRVWENMSSPFMTGIFKPTLVLPAENLSEEQLNNILRHEMTHFKRHDILYKWFATLVKCVHWFNPVIWYVAKQINAECEISCDMTVTLEMSKSQEMSYIDTVLSLLLMGKTKQIPLTTQMASNKKTLKRRFEMIRNKKKTSKFVSVLSAVIAVVMLGTTVFASGVLSDLATDDYTIEITNNGEKIELANKPFIENSEVYVPLRDLFEKVGVTEHPESRIEWNNGKIYLSIAYYTDKNITLNGNGDENINIAAIVANHAIEIGKSSIMENTVPNLAGQNRSEEVAMDSAPILRGSNTYIPYSYVRRILDTQQWNINYSAYDKNGNLIDSSEKAKEPIRNPEPEFFSDNGSEFLGDNINYVLGQIGVEGPFEINIINHKYNDDHTKATYYIQIRQGNSDSFDYLTIVFTKGSDGWIINDYYLEK